VSRAADPSPDEPVSCLSVRDIGEINAGDDLAAAICASASLQDGDVLVVTSKVVSKAEGQVRRTTKAEAVAEETDRVLAERGETVIVRNRQGLVMAAAGVDMSNTRTGTVVLLPRDPDDSARRLRVAVQGLTGREVAVVVTDTSGRAWRTGQTDIAIGVAGLEVTQDYAGRVDGYGNPLLVTLMAVADEIAAAADLVKGKLSGCPAAVVRGLGRLVLPPGQHGPGARALVRDERDDMFGYGAREAVVAALHAEAEGLRGFGRRCDAEALATRLRALGGIGTVTAVAPDRVELALPAVTGLDEARQAGRTEARATALAFACGWIRGSGRDQGLSFVAPS
jgi:coenzyme F420-0:L-glutamate ligase/coenzyme F420-1:gamma-L-glutamate ligase